MTIKRARKKKELLIPFEKVRDGVLKDKLAAAHYLQLALEEGLDEFLPALRNVAQSHGMSAVARRARLTRPALYKLLSAEGNPHARNLWQVVAALGLKFELAGGSKSPEGGAGETLAA